MSPQSQQAQTGWRAHAGELAWGTVLLFLAVVAGEALVWWGVLTRQLPIWAGTLIAAVLAYVGFTVMHEGTHGNIDGGRPRWRWLSEVAGWFCGFLLLAPYSLFRVLHLQHHASTNHPEKDPDLWVRGHNWLAVLGRCATILIGYDLCFFHGSASKTHAGRTAKRISVIGLLGQLALLVTLIATGLGWYALWLWIVPALLAATVLAFLFDWVPHHPHSAQGRFVDTRILLVPGLTLPMLWQNYHLIHHLYPRVPFYRYARCFRDVRAELEAHGSPIEGFEKGHRLPRPFTTGGPAAHPAE